MEEKCNTSIIHDVFECAECDYEAGTEHEMMGHSVMHTCEGLTGHVDNTHSVIHRCVGQTGHVDDTMMMDQSVIHRCEGQNGHVDDTVMMGQTIIHRCDGQTGHVDDTVMMDQNAKHRNKNEDKIGSNKNCNRNVYIEDALVNIKSEWYNAHNEDALVNIKNEQDILKETFIPKMFTTINENQNKHNNYAKYINKTEICLNENNSAHIDLREIKCENKKIKSEEVDIDQNIELCFSSDNISDHEIINEEPYPLDKESLKFSHHPHRVRTNAPLQRKASGRKASGIPGVVIGVDDSDKYIPEGWQRIVYQYTKDYKKGKYKTSYISPTGKLLNCKKQVSKHIKYLRKIGISSSVDVQQMDFTKATHFLSRNKKRRRRLRERRVEIEVDNTNIYIPDGWKRKVFQYFGSTQSRPCYISPFNKEIFGYAAMKQYIEQWSRIDQSFSVDIERLTFRPKSEKIEKIETNIPEEEVELDNTGMYIPVGWQRKAVKGNYGHLRVVFISTTGNIMNSKSEVLEHIKHLEKQGITYSVDMEQINFTIRRKSRILGKVVEVDNTGKYIPDGWQRKAYLSKAVYISPTGSIIHSRSVLLAHIKKLEEQGIISSVDIDQMDFTIQKKLQIIGEEVEVDNTGKYIPDGWQRKVYRVTDGPVPDGPLKVVYISPTGDMHNRYSMKAHIKNLDIQGIVHTLDIEQLDFTTQLNVKVEIEVDNTNEYIPEGWKRKAYKYTTGVKKICFISPFNKQVQSMGTMIKYLAQLNNLCPLSVDLKRLNFSFKDFI